MLRSRLLLLSGAFLIGAAGVHAQVTPPFTYSAQVGTTVQPINDGGAIQFAADALNRPVDGTLTLTYRGAGSVALTRFDFGGSTDFTVSNLPQEGAVLTPSQSFTVNIRFSPTTSLKTTAFIRVFYIDSPPTPPGGRPVSGSTTVNFAGVAPEFTFAVVVPQPGGNAVPINSGDKITFPATAVNDTTTALVIITNKGTGAGTLGAIRLTGPATLTLGSLPVPPVTVDPNRELRFSIKYAPTLIENITGSVSVELFDRTVYRRGGMTLQALREAIGDDAFFTVLARWVDEHRHASASTADFIALAEEVSGQQLDDLFQRWLYEPRLPSLG